MTDYSRNIVNNQTENPPATLIRRATILSMDENVGNIERGDILVTGSTITAIGKDLNAEGVHVIDATNMIAMPGMVDSHRHAWEGQLRRINPNATCLDDYSNATHFARETVWISFSSGRTGPSPLFTSGECFARVSLAAISISSVTRDAPEAITPRPIPGKI